MEESLEEALKAKVHELEATLTDLKQYDFAYNVSKLQSSLPKLKRCPICTLKLPCKHYNSLSEVPVYSPSPAPQSLLETRILLPPCDPNNPNKISFSIMYRGREKHFSIDPSSAFSVPGEKRCNLLSSIEKYHESKLKEELKKQELLNLEESRIKSQQIELDAAKQKYFLRQKEKIRKHQEEIQQRLNLKAKFKYNSARD